MASDTSFSTSTEIDFPSENGGSSTPYDTTSLTRTYTGLRSLGRPSTVRPRTAISTLGPENQDIICAVSESRGISPVVGLAFVNLDTAEAVLCQLNDSQTYVRTIHKLAVFSPTTIVIVKTSANPKSKLFSILEESLDDLEGNITLLDRRYWSEPTGLEYIQRLAFQEDVDSVTTAVSGSYYAVCCFAAVLKYTDLRLAKTFLPGSLRIKYEPSEGSMTIDLATIHSLELVQNLHYSKSKDCLFGLLNETFTAMGARLLRSNMLQPLTNSETLNVRYDALEELSTKEEMFFAVRQALKPILDADKMLTRLILIPNQTTLKDTEQAINNVIMLKNFVNLIKPVSEALQDANSSMLQAIGKLCTSEGVDHIQDLINDVLWCPVVFSLVWVLMKVLIYAENGIDCYLPLCVSTIC